MANPRMFRWSGSRPGRRQSHTSRRPLTAATSALSCSCAETLERRLLLTYTTVVDSGPSDNRVDIVFLGDGYTASEIETVYVDHINEMLGHMFGAEDPYPRYQNFFNVHRINVISAQSGADNSSQGGNVDTALNARYFCNGIERLLCIDQSKARQVLTAELSDAPFGAEVQLVTVNDAKYGGSGGNFAVYAGANSSATELALHELGHSFNNLADEYFTPGATYTGSEPTPVNVTTSPTGDKWAHWHGYDQPGIGVIGAYAGGFYNQTGIYRPSQNSKMRNLGRPFDAVSREKIIQDIYDLVDPLDDWRDNSVSITEASPQLWVDVIDPAVIDVEWSVNGQLVVGATSESFRPEDFGFTAPYSVSARAYDPTDWVRTGLQELEQSITWQVETSMTQEPDLVATQFNAISDRVQKGQTDVAFTLENQGNAASGSFQTHIIWSPNNIVGDADDVVVADSTAEISDLSPGGTYSGLLTLNLDLAALYKHAVETTNAGQPGGTVASDISHLFLVVDSKGDVSESDEDNNSGQKHLVDSDDIIYFPWDVNGNGAITPVEALSAIHAVNTSDSGYDFDGNGVVSPLEALSVLQRIGYVVDTSVVGDSPAALAPVAAEVSTVDSSAKSITLTAPPLLVPEDSATPILQSAHSANSTPVGVFADTEDDEDFMATAKDQMIAETTSGSNTSEAIDDQFQNRLDWLSVV